MNKWKLDDNGGKSTQYDKSTRELADFFDATGKVDKSTVSNFDMQFERNDTYTKKMHFKKRMKRFSVFAVILLLILGVGYYFVGVRTYDVTLSLNDGNGEEVVLSSNFGKHIEFPTDINREGYHLVGWFTEDGEEWKPNEDRVLGTVGLIAKWGKNQYTVTFDLNNGDEDIVVSAEYDEHLERPSNIEKTEYHLIGWFTQDGQLWDFAKNVVQCDTTIKAKWAPDQMTISYDSVDGQCDMTSQEVHYQDKFTMPMSQKRGYTFLGWSVSAESEAPEYPAGNTANKLPDEEDGIVQMFAIYKINNYTITCNGNNGSSAKKLYYTVNDTYVNIGEPSREVRGNCYASGDYSRISGTYYSFAGWYVDSQLTVPYDSGMLNELKDIQLYAKWQEEVHNVQLNLNGGSLTLSNVNSYINDTQLILPTSASKDGCIFAGWYEYSNGQGKFYRNITLKDANDKNLYAYWVQDKSYSIDISGTSESVSNYTGNATFAGESTFEIEVPDELKNIQSTGHLYVEIEVKCNATFQYRSEQQDATAIIKISFDEGDYEEIARLVATGGGWPALWVDPAYGDKVSSNSSSSIKTYALVNDKIEIELDYQYIIEFTEYKNWAGGTHAVNFTCDLSEVIYRFYIG